MCWGVVECDMLTCLFALFLNSDVFCLILSVTLCCWEGFQCLSFLEDFGSVITLLESIYCICLWQGSHLCYYKHTANEITLLCFEFRVMFFTGVPLVWVHTRQTWQCCPALSSAYTTGPCVFTPFLVLLLHWQPHWESGSHTSQRSTQLWFLRLPEWSSFFLIDLGWGRKGMRLQTPVHVPLSCCLVVTWGSSSSPFCHLFHIDFSHINY